jgi:hypothetical protein
MITPLSLLFLLQDAPITPPRHDTVVALGIGILAILVSIAAAVIYSRAVESARLPRRLAVAGIAGGVAWIILIGALSATGTLSRTDMRPHPGLLLFVAVFVIAVAVGLSRVGRAMSEHISLLALIALQSFRLPLEIVMNRAASLGIMPRELSYAGGGLNFDILTGASAIILSVLIILRVGIPKRTLWVWNLYGIACLLAITGVAVATSPVVALMGHAPEKLNTWVLYFPYVWLPGILVLVALTTHIVITRKLLRMRVEA